MGMGDASWSFAHAIATVSPDCYLFLWLALPGFPVHCFSTSPLQRKPPFPGHVRNQVLLALMPLLLSLLLRDELRKLV